MMRGARTVYPAAMGVSAKLLSAQMRHQSDAVPPAYAEAKGVADLTSHIRANDAGAAAAATSRGGEGAAPQQQQQQQRRMDSVRDRMRRGGNNNNSTTNDNEPAPEDPVAVSQRIFRDAVRDTDPLGGQFHKDYFRDPAKGYAPQHAPRNFADGGRVDYHTPTSKLAAEMSAASRADGDHLAMRYRQHAAELRAAARDMSPADFAAFAAERGKTLQEGAPTRQRFGASASEAFKSVMSSHGRAAYVPDQFEVASRQKSAHATGARSGTSLADAVAHSTASAKQREFEFELEAFRNIHGQRSQEAHEFELSRRTARRPLPALDVDRYNAVRAGKLYGQASFDPLLPSSNMAEAQTNLRKNALPDEAAIYAKGLSRNTVQEQPLTGEQLTQSLLGVKRLTARDAEAKWEAARREAIGIGRHGPLTQESGPDRRKMKLHKNDERLLNAHKFVTDAYHTQLRGSLTNAHSNHGSPIERNTSSGDGLGHLLSNKFDLDRRGALLSKGKADPAESLTAHYGTPITEQLDAFVRSHRNAKGERHTDYFLPHPTRQDMLLSTSYRDAEGFPLHKPKPDFLEWELFIRYRAHHQQRRRLALVHGLEPVPNETVHERDARRARLDQLCEATPFDASYTSKLKSGELAVTIDGLRRHFGAYFVPSPTIVDMILGDANASLQVTERPASNTSDVADTREHLLSARYLNAIAQKEGYAARLRAPPKEARTAAPEPEIDYLPDAIVATFSAKEFALYQQYINQQTAAHEKRYTEARQRRRWIAERGAWSTDAISGDAQILVCDAVDCTTGATVVIPLRSGVADSDGNVTIDGVAFKPVPATGRAMTMMTVTFEDGSTMQMDEKDYHSRPLAVTEEDPNAGLNHASPGYHYNRMNYIETQDAIWEEGTYRGEEGWTVAHEDDGLRVGLPVLARRPVKRADGSTLAEGEAQRAEIVQFDHQPFFNPNPRHVTVRFVVDGTVESVPLAGVYVWQLTRNGPQRTVPDETRRPNQSVKRFVDVADPLGEKVRPPHFLDQYRVASAEDPFRSVKQITDIDLFNINDDSRPDNTRPLTIAGRKNYVRQRYVPHFTPWDWIIAQEMDAPLIAEQLRKTGAGDSLLFSPNRYWRYKRRGHGYVQNSPHEVRDLFRYIDQITPWAKAQKVRNLWEVRQHHPIPKFHRPEVAMHRNTPSLLPSHMWDLDKKTGKVRALKDSVATYQTLEPYPKWVQL